MTVCIEFINISENGRRVNYFYYPVNFPIEIFKKLDMVAILLFLLKRLRYFLSFLIIIIIIKGGKKERDL